jgi:hypothetical protein
MKTIKPSTLGFIILFLTLFTTKVFAAGYQSHLVEHPSKHTRIFLLLVIKKTVDRKKSPSSSGEGLSVLGILSVSHSKIVR